MTNPPASSAPGETVNAPVFRFAPSPNGQLHLGHAYAALVNLALARKAGGVMLLRIEDIDTVRCTEANCAAMLRDLEWIGFEWDRDPMRQSERFEAYRDALETLLGEGLAYPALLSRRQIAEAVERETATGHSWPVDPDGAPHYPGTERQLALDARVNLATSDEPYAMRLDMAAATRLAGRRFSWVETGSGPDGQTGQVSEDCSVWDDAVLGRRDTPASYHLSSVLDDDHQGVTHVVRGRDLYHATSLHRLLQELFHLAVPIYHHHDLLLDQDGRKLSKSRGDTALASLREAGMTPADIRRMIGLDG